MYVGARSFLNNFLKNQFKIAIYVFQTVFYHLKLWVSWAHFSGRVCFGFLLVVAHADRDVRRLLSILSVVGN